MHTAAPLLIAADCAALFKAHGFIDASEDFVDAKFEDATALAAILPEVVTILQTHGIAVPAQLGKLIAAAPILIPLLPALESFIGAVK
jgi:isopropylmalate/homocitrate/citramalate synthase